MAHFPKPAEGSWTQHYPELGTGTVSYEDSISPEHYELEREAIFKRSWLNVGRIEQLTRTGSYFTKELVAAGTSVIVVKGGDGTVRSFHNICRHRGNKLVWNDFPGEEVDRIAAGPDAPGWGALDGALVRAVDELVADGAIGDATWAALSAELDARQLLDVIFTVGAYDALAMALSSFRVELDDDLRQ